MNSIATKYKAISPEDLERTKGRTWSIENMAGHDAAGRSVEYIGSVTKGDIITDYFIDSAGAYWFQDRGIVEGEIVSMEVYIFGHETGKKDKRKWQKNT